MHHRPMALHYLTVQDVLTLNLQITGAPQPFDYARLEEAVFYQYAPGQSDDLVRQAARFLSGFVKMRPFAEGNEACAFAGTVAFLQGNGLRTTAEDSNADAIIPAFSDRAHAEAWITTNTQPDHVHAEHGVPEWEEIFAEVVERYAVTLASLSESAPSLKK